MATPPRRRKNLQNYVQWKWAQWISVGAQSNINSCYIISCPYYVYMVGTAYTPIGKKRLDRKEISWINHPNIECLNHDEKWSDGRSPCALIYREANGIHLYDVWLYILNWSMSILCPSTVGTSLVWWYRGCGLCTQTAVNIARPGMVRNQEQDTQRIKTLPNFSIKMDWSPKCQANVWTKNVI